MTQNIDAPFRKVQVWIFSNQQNDLEVLLLRTNTKRGNFWQSVTGKVENGETFEEAALRELLEETGISPHLSLKRAGFSFQFESRFGLATEEVFYVKCDHQDPTLDPNEHDAFQWVSAQEALERVKFDSSRSALKHILQAMNS